MGSHKTTKGASSSTQKASGSNTSVQHHVKRRKPGVQDDVPGVQKIKAALRQTKRLLAKENLAADVRVTTERRLKSLEGDLARAELARTERTMAVRYHKVKFFERQKVLRKITRSKRMLESGVDAENEKLSKTKSKALEADLRERRIDLNYILHYPKTSKYISLFPPSANTEGEGSEPEEEEESQQDPIEKDETDITSKKRQELREAIQEAMDAGKISVQPEVDLVDRAGSGSLVHAASTEKPELKEPSGGKKHSKSKPRAPTINEDGFFDMSVD